MRMVKTTRDCHRSTARLVPECTTYRVMNAARRRSASAGPTNEVVDSPFAVIFLVLNSGVMLVHVRTEGGAVGIVQKIRFVRRGPWSPIAPSRMYVSLQQPNIVYCIVPFAKLHLQHMPLDAL